MNDYSDIYEQAGRANNVDPKLLAAVGNTESANNPNTVSKKGAVGVMQLLPSTAQGLGVTDLNDPVQNIYAGAKYLSQQLDKYKDVPTALAAYNAGPGAVDQHGGIPPYPETQSYIQKTMAKYQGQPSQSASQPLPGLPPVIQKNQPAQVDHFSNSMGQSSDQSSSSMPGLPPVVKTATASNQSADPFSALMAQSAAPTTAPAANATSANINQSSQKTTQDQPNQIMSTLAGVGRGVQETALGAQQLIGHGLSNFDATKNAGNWLINDANQGLANGASEVAPYAAANPKSTAVGQFVGNVGATAPLSALAPVAAGATLLGRVGVGAGLGAAGNLLMPVANDSVNNPDFAKQKTIQGLTGAAIGGVANPLLHALGGTISPTIGQAQQKLIDAGVPLTPGQIKGGYWSKLEDMATSLPGVGGVIRNSQQRALQGFNAATYDQVLAPLGVKFSDVANGASAGTDGVAAVKNAISNVYDNTLSKMTFQPDPQFQSGLQQLATMAKSLPATEQAQFMDTIQRQVADKLNPQTMSMDGQTLKQVQGELGRISKNWSGDPSTDKRNLGAAVGEIKGLIEDSLSRNNAPELVDSLKNANSAYANYARLRGAAGSSGAMNNDGVFTAAQLQSAVRNGDKSVGKGATATGNALMQDWSGAGQQVLGNKYPDSGTAGRSMLGYLLGGGAVAAPGAIIPTMAGAGLASLPYTVTGNRLASALLTQRPGLAAPIGRGIMSASPFAVPTANALGNLINQSK